MIELLPILSSFLNILALGIILPAYKSYKAEREAEKEQIKKQQEQIVELKRLNGILTEELKTLKALVFRTVPADILQKHITSKE